MRLSDMSRTKQTTVLTVIQLMERANRDKSAQKALDQYHEIENAGGNPEIRYSDFNGYLVIDRSA